MRPLLAALALVLAAPVPVSAQSFGGCGAIYGTCASVAVSAVPRPDGTWVLTVTVANTSGRRSGIVDEVLVHWETDNWDDSGMRDIRATDATGEGRTSHYMPATGLGEAGFSGYRERLDGRTNDMMWAQSAGVESTDCARDPACAALRIPPWYGPRGDTALVAYHRGPVTFRFTLEGFDPATAYVSVRQNFIDGVGAESYDLTPVTATPEPVTLTLVGAGLAGVGLVRRRRRRPPH